MTTWHSQHKQDQHWIQKAIGIALLAVGSVGSLVIHTLWFIGWFADKSSVNLLTNIVSLEAIYLAIFLLIDGRNKDKQAEAQALHFQQTVEMLNGKLDALLDTRGIAIPRD